MFDRPAGRVCSERRTIYRPSTACRQVGQSVRRSQHRRRWRVSAGYGGAIRCLWELTFILPRAVGRTSPGQLYFAQECIVAGVSLKGFKHRHLHKG